MFQRLIWCKLFWHLSEVRFEGVCNNNLGDFIDMCMDFILASDCRFHSCQQFYKLPLPTQLKVSSILQ